MSAFFLFLAYFFDCCDGFFARKYDMITVAGDLYDHITDLFTYAIIIYLIYNKYKYRVHKIYLISIIIFGILSLLIQLGCQEIHHNEDTSATIKSTKMFCPKQKNVESVMKYTRYFGFGTFVVILLSFILCSKYIEKN